MTLLLCWHAPFLLDVVDQFRNMNANCAHFFSTPVSWNSFLAAVDAEAKAGQGQMMGGMPAPPAQFAPAAPPVGTALGEMSAPLSQGPSGECLVL